MAVVVIFFMPKSVVYVVLYLVAKKVRINTGLLSEQILKESKIFK